MVRVLILLILLAMVAWVVWTFVRAARARARGADSATEGFQVLESVGDGEARVEIGRPLSGEAVLIGTVALDAADFDDRYAELVLQAEDRVTTLNASRSLRSSS